MILSSFCHMWGIAENQPSNVWLLFSLKQIDLFKAWGKTKLQHLWKCVCLRFPSQRCLIQILWRGESLNVHILSDVHKDETGACLVCIVIINLNYNIWNLMTSSKRALCVYPSSDPQLRARVKWEVSETNCWLQDPFTTHTNTHTKPFTDYI